MFGSFAPNTWTVRRYALPSYNEERLSWAILAWAKQRGVEGKYGASYSIDSISRGYFFPGGNPAEAIVVAHVAPTLYVYTSKQLPETLWDIHEEVIVPYTRERGGAPIAEVPQVFTTTTAWHSPHKKFEEQLKHFPLQPAVPIDVKVHLDPELKRVPVATETLRVTEGVNVKVRRERVIEHTTNVNWRVMGGADLGIGFKEIVKASIRGELERTRGTAIKESLTISHEVEVSGSNAPAYDLIWAEVWATGTVEIVHGDETYLLPFEVRERAELVVTMSGKVAAARRARRSPKLSDTPE